MGRPKYSDGNNASINPPVQAQSAGDQNTLSDCPSARRGLKPNQFWLQTNPLKLPISARCGISAPLGCPVVPLV